MCPTKNKSLYLPDKQDTRYSVVTIASISVQNSAIYGYTLGCFLLFVGSSKKQEPSELTLNNLF